MAILQVSRPTPKPVERDTKRRRSAGDILGIAGTIIGGVAGGIAGGPGGAVGGASAGGGLGRQVGGFIQGPQQQGGGSVVASAPSPVQTTDSAISRRMRAGEEDPLETLRQAQEAIASLPPQQQARFQAPIGEALSRAQQGNRRFV